MALFKRKPNQVDETIAILETALINETRPDKRALIEEELKILYDLQAKKNANKWKPSADTVFKGLTAALLAGIGYYADKNGSIIPKWAKEAFSHFKM